jgi:hypothetical protein
VIEPPTDTFIEKNWVPLVLDNPASEFHGRELFIYGVVAVFGGEDSWVTCLEIVYQTDKTPVGALFS